MNIEPLKIHIRNFKSDEMRAISILKNEYYLHAKGYNLTQDV